MNPQELAMSWKSLTLTNDPVTASLRQPASAAASLGLLHLNGVDRNRIYELWPVNKVLKTAGEKQVAPPP